MGIAFVGKSVLSGAECIANKNHQQKLKERKALSGKEENYIWITAKKMCHKKLRKACLFGKD